jgi:error-prone DNA polymerase
MGLDRRQALWAIKALPPAPLPLFAAAGAEEMGPEPAVRLPEMAPGEHVADDYRSLRLSLKAHPVSFLRPGLARDRFVPAARLAEMRNGGRVLVAGIVLVRQRPGSASGVIFTTLEDETGVANIVIWPNVFERFRRTVLRASMLGVEGRLQIEGLVIHVVADRLYDLTGRLAALADPDAAGRRPPPPAAPLARADEVKRPGPDPVARRDQPRGLFRSRDFH